MPGGKFTTESNGQTEDIDLGPISGKLKSWGPFTATLAESLEDLKKSGGVYNPRKLFMALTKIWQQFAGGDQHDSHELLRHLLESVKYVLFEFVLHKQKRYGKFMQFRPKFTNLP